MAGEYSYFLFDYLTLTPQGAVSLEDVSFDLMFNGAGGFSGNLPIADGLPQLGDTPDVSTARAAVRAQVSSIVEGKSALIVDRDGVVVWGGMVWTTRYDSHAEVLSINGTEDWSWWGHRVIDEDLPLASSPLYSGVDSSGVNLGYTGKDQLAVACDILNWAQTDANGNCGLIVPVSPVSGVPMNLKMRYYEKRTIRDAIETIAKQANGFDFRIDVDYESGLPVRRFTIGFPRRGVAAANSGLVFDYPGNVVGYTLSTDGTQLANTVFSLGAGNAEQMVADTEVNAAMLAAGYPLLETVVSYKDMADQTGLQRLTKAQLNLLSNAPYNSAPQIPVLTVRADADPMLGSYTVGDEARIIINDPMFPPKSDGTNGLDIFLRIIAVSVTPPTTHNVQELVTVTLGQPFTQ